MGKTKLKIGLLLDSLSVSAWELKMIENIINSDYAELSLAVINNRKPVPINKTLAEKIKNNRGRVFYLTIRKILEVVYSKFIERKTYLPSANVARSCENAISAIPHIYVDTIRKKWSDYFKEDDIQAIAKHEIDIFIRLGFGILRGDILRSAKFGIWSFHHGDNRKNRGGPAGFWESMECWPETGSILQILTEDLDNGKVLYRSFSCTDMMSVADNMSNYFWKSLSFMERKMKELYTNGEQAFFEKVELENRHPEFYSERLYVAPTNKELAILTYRKIVEKTRMVIDNVFLLDQWILMFHVRDEFSSSLWRYKKIIPPKDRFWADPHVLYKDHKYYIFIEEYLYSTDKGHIALITMDEKGNYSEPETVLDKSYHLSYPFVFEYEGEFYMIPESMANKTVELYRCTEFPHKWEYVMNLMEGVEAVDATVFYHNDKWWMFVNMVENEGASTWDELFLFYADNLKTNQWISHPLNPVVSDCKSARPAGKIFVENGTLYRPSQNCSVRYGYGFNVCEIVKLSEQQYEENIVSHVEPNWDKNIIGTHTFNRVNSLHIIDAIYRRKK